jgi:hypothetical protein
MKKIIYLIIFSLLTLGFAIYGRMTWGDLTIDGNVSLEYVMFIGCYPPMIYVLHSCLRLYLIPGELFDPWSGIAQSDSERFRQYNTWVSIMSTFVGIAILILF